MRSVFSRGPMMMMMIVVVFYLYALSTANVFVSLFDFDFRECFLHDTHERRDDGIHENDDKDDDVCVTNNASFYVSSAFEDDVAVHDRE